jgi:hypothetical protein
MDDYNYNFEIRTLLTHFAAAFDGVKIRRFDGKKFVNIGLKEGLKDNAIFSVRSVKSKVLAFSFKGVDFIDNNNILKTFGSAVVSSYKEEALKYYKKYLNPSYQYILSDMLQYAHTWDNYALSILFLRILIGLHRTINVKNKFIIYFMKLLVGNIHLSPFKRLTIRDTLAQFDSILEQMVPKDYTDIIEHLQCN